MRGELGYERINERMSPREIGELYTAVYALCCISGEARDYQDAVYEEFLEEIDFLLDILPTLVPLSSEETSSGDDLRELDEKLAKMKVVFRLGSVKIFTVFRYLERFHVPKCSKPTFKELREIKFSRMVFSHRRGLLSQVVEAWVVAISNGYKNKVNVELPPGLRSELQAFEDTDPQAAQDIKLGVQLAVKRWEIVKALYHRLAMDVIRFVCEAVL